jgi:hypothetical protein
MEGEVQTSEVHAPPLGLSEATLPEPPVTSPPIPSLPVRPQPPASMRSSAALSIDEMWKRVSDEIDKPIFPYRAETSISKKDETDVAAAKSDEVSIPETTPEETAPDHDDLGRGPSKILDEIDSKIFERDAAERELSAFAHPDRVSDLGGETASLHVSEEPEAEDHWSIALRSSRNFARPRGDVQKEESFDFAAGARASRTEEPTPFAMSRSASALDDRFGHDDLPLNRFDTAWSRIGSDHSTRETIEKPLVDPPPVVPEPTVIGRYEAEETAYLMFSDGSIEAQSEKGIFRFASMADLKAFIENKQAAASSA